MLNPKRTKRKRRYLRNNMTKWEIRLWNNLKQKKILGYKVRRQYGVNNYVIDFYCPKLKLGIEIDGKIHSQHGRSIQDQEKDRILKTLGIKVIRISILDMAEDYGSVVLHLEDQFKKGASELVD